jgi:enamine deaminase RidA (YjgF/YER057c/UK114 family)
MIAIMKPFLRNNETIIAIMAFMIAIFATMIVIVAFMTAIFVSMIVIMKPFLRNNEIMIAIVATMISIFAFMMGIFISFVTLMKTGAPITTPNTINNTLTMRKLITILTILVALAFQTKAQTAPNVQLINPVTVATPRGYSHAAVIDLGNCKMVIMSGQVALDPKGNLVGANDIAKQTEQVFRNIKSIVEAAGGKMDHLVKLGYFSTDVSRISDVRTIRDQFINTKTPPASTLVQVNKLFREDVLIEIEATAIIPK